MLDTPPRWRTIIASDFDPDTLRAVGMAFREKRFAGKMDLPAWRHAARTYLRLHPDRTWEDAALTVTEMTNIFVRDNLDWFWRDCPSRGWPVPREAYIDDEWRESRPPTGREGV